jgi:hypothetical protein
VVTIELRDDRNSGGRGLCNSFHHVNNNLVTGSTLVLRRLRLTPAQLQPVPSCPLVDYVSSSFVQHNGPSQQRPAYSHTAFILSLSSHVFELSWKASLETCSPPASFNSFPRLAVVVLVHQASEPFSVVPEKLAAFCWPGHSRESRRL